MGTPATMNDIRQALGVCSERLGFAQVASMQWERQAAVVRDAMLTLELDPTDTVQVRALLCGAYLALAQISQCPVIIGPALPHTTIVCMVAQKWLDGELPVPTLLDEAELLGFLSAPPCEEMVIWPTGRGSSRCLLEAHAGPHKVQVIDNGVVVEVEVE